MTKKTVVPTKVVIPCRLSFANIWEPRSFNGGEAKYSVCCIIPKRDKETLKKIYKAVEMAMGDAREKKWKGVIPEEVKLPLRDGDVERGEDENYAGCMFMNASSRTAPQIVDRMVKQITDPRECGSGDYANVSLNFYGYCVDGKSGIAAGLGNIQKVRDGERMSGRAKAEDEFEKVDEAENEAEEIFGEMPF